MQPIATYSEVRFDGKRTFTLFSDKIVVRGKQTLKSEFEVAIALTKLDPTPDTLRFRSKSFTAGMLNAVIGFVGCTILISGFHMNFATPAPGILACIGMSGILLMAATARKVEFIRFKNDADIAILDIARSGRHAAQLDAFIDALTKQIRMSRGAA